MEPCLRGEEISDGEGGESSENISYQSESDLKINVIIPKPLAKGKRLKLIFMPLTEGKISHQLTRHMVFKFQPQVVSLFLVQLCQVY